jgi:hypothetical protein
MAATNFTPIQLYYSSTAAAAPSAGNLTSGELAININDGKLFYKDSGGAVQTIASKGSGTIGGSTTQVQYNNAGVLAGSANFTFDGTTAVLNTLNLTNALGVLYGGTGQTTYTDGQLLIGNTTGNTLTKATLTAGSGVTITNAAGAITINATGSGGTVTSVGWTGGIVSVGTATTTPAFTIAGTSGGIPYFDSGTTWASSAALAASAIVLGGGAGAAPATTTTGTGVVTAIGINVNTTGGLVTQSGTLAASSLLVGGGSGVAIQSATTGAGVVTALGVSTNATGGFPTINGTATLTNKRIDPRVSSAASAASITPDIASFDQYALTAQAVNLTINAPIGTPVDGNKLVIRILDNGTTRTLTWNATFTVIGVTLPGSTTASKMLYVGCIYNAANTRWDVIAVTTQA